MTRPDSTGARRRKTRECHRDFRIQYHAKPLRCQATTSIGANDVQTTTPTGPTIASTRPVRTGRNAGGANEAGRSFEKPRVVTKREDLRRRGGTGSKT